MNIDMSNTCPARSLLAMHVFVTGPSDYIQICLGRDISILKLIVHEKTISQRASVVISALCSLLVKFLWQWFNETLSTKELYRFNDLHKWTNWPFFVSLDFLKLKQEQCLVTKTWPNYYRAILNADTKERAKITAPLMLLPLFYLLIRCPT